MERLESEGVSQSQVVDEVKQVLPKNAILVGANIQQDVQWLGLREGVDFQVPPIPWFLIWGSGASPCSVATGNLGARMADETLRCGSFQETCAKRPWASSDACTSFLSSSIAYIPS